MAGNRTTVCFVVLAGFAAAAAMSGCGGGLLCPLGTEEDSCGFYQLMWSGAGTTDTCHTCELPDGTFHGPYEIRRSEGSLKVRGFHFEGESCGTWRTFDIEGRLISREDKGPCGLFAFPGAI